VTLSALRSPASSAQHRSRGSSLARMCAWLPKNESTRAQCTLKCSNLLPDNAPSVA
jgi:hypothetical protein